MSTSPDWIKKARSQWEYYGQKRPAFAIEPQEGQESVWDYPRPPRLENDSREVIIRVGETEILKTRRSIRVLETASPPTFYFPAEEIEHTFLRPGFGTSFCEWKGKAKYWDIVVKDKVISGAGWSYPKPFSKFKLIAGYLSFYPSKLDCYVDGERVCSQPGGFYGGWITNEIVGPVKGESSETML